MTDRSTGQARSRGLSQGPLVSVIMPVWPRPEWLREAVGSALGQRACRIELVVVDDGCPQPVATLLREIDDERLRPLRIPHAGVSSVRNAGIEAAHGDLFRFVDADDVLEPQSTARLVDLVGHGECHRVRSDPRLRPRAAADLEDDVSSRGSCTR
jgi:glycosyltransferase involved in cell wall biosynthesis